MGVRLTQGGRGGATLRSVDVITAELFNFTPPVWLSKLKPLKANNAPSVEAHTGDMNNSNICAG